jgi:hypothetical protein
LRKKGRNPKGRRERKNKTNTNTKEGIVCWAHNLSVLPRPCHEFLKRKRRRKGNKERKKKGK